MMEHAVYAVISPEGCASILWRTAEKEADAAEAMRVTAGDLKDLGVIDRIVPEPLGGADSAPTTATVALGAIIGEENDNLAALSPQDAGAQRGAKHSERGRAAGRQRVGEKVKRAG